MIQICAIISLNNNIKYSAVLINYYQVSFVNKFGIYEITNKEFTQIFSHELPRGVECRWNKHGDILIW
jgi:hypothetical protein